MYLKGIGDTIFWRIRYKRLKQERSLNSWKCEVDIYQDGKDFGTIGSSVTDVVKFKMPFRCLIEEMEEADRHTNLEFGEKVWAGDTCW